ncbi:hypothetical protein AYO39_00415 [Actinobacteria bacterium SCGC AG-212-D09]|nr:hypothetical protein AYO39_00415 [Actinobacteria bacterium SCGC AG-212-D09]
MWDQVDDERADRADRKLGAALRPTRSRPLTREDVMTAREVAELLRMPRSTVYQLARQGVLPASRLGRTWRFLRPQLEELLAGSAGR